MTSADTKMSPCARMWIAAALVAVGGHLFGAKTALAQLEPPAAAQSESASPNSEGLASESVPVADSEAAPVEPDAAHPYGWLSTLPPLVAIVLAITTRRVFASLFLGVCVGAMILARGNPLFAVGHTLETYLWPSLINPDNMRVFVFTLLMGAMVGVMHRSGGMHALVDRLVGWVTNPRRAQLTTWALGMLIFFDDYANSLLLGGTLRPMTDRLKISREKLAYLVDSTAAPVAGLALISNWVAVELGYIQAGLDQLGPAAGDLDAFALLVATIPYRFYILGALLLVVLVGWMGRDFGPMLTAERRARGGHVASSASGIASYDDLPPPSEGMPRRMHLALVPVAVLVGVVVWLMCLTGSWGIEQQTGQSFAELQASSAHPLDAWIALLGDSDSYMALVYGALAGLLTVSGLALGERIASFREVRGAAWVGAQAMFPALVILWLSWSLAVTTGEEHLKTGEYLGSLIGPNLSVSWMPTVVFLLAAVVAFSTGTSWGTMGILMPLVVEVTATMMTDAGLDVTDTAPIFVASIGGVLAGAIFGDHCSPISDTTVLSSRASGCDHIAHVRTQLPYALLVATVSVVCGTLPVAFGLPVGWSLLLGTAALVVALRVLGRKVSET